MSQKSKILALYQAHDDISLTVDTVSSMTKIKRKTVEGRSSELRKEGKLIKVSKITYRYNGANQNG